MPSRSEPHYFARDFWREKGRNGMRPRLPRQYLKLFDQAGPDQIRGEASSNYLYSTVAAAEIACARPDAKIVAIFREPTDFVHAYYIQRRRSPLPDYEP